MIGTSLGHYEILEPLGAGGMGEVYLAEDTRLGRKAAIKILPQDLAREPERRERFEREAKLLASLNHANIAAIYGLEGSGDATFIAMEYVEGETLADRMARGPIEMSEALGLARLDGSAPVTVVPCAGAGRYVVTGHLVYLSQDAIHAAPLDLATATVTGPAVKLDLNVAFSTQGGGVQLAVADNGTLAYVVATAVSSAEMQLAWVDAEGRAEPAALQPHNYSDLRLSPDGRKVATHLFEGDNDIWVVDLVRGDATRITFEQSEDETPLWSPDGLSLAYASSRDGGRVVFLKRADGSANAVETPIWRGPEHLHLNDWSAVDGKLIAELARAGSNDVIAIDIETGEETPLLTSSFDEKLARLSPDGRWLAYVSEESGQEEVYVQRYPELDVRVPVSTEGGTEPVWSRDGRTLYFRSSQGIMAAALLSDEDIEFAVPEALFPDTYARPQAGNHTHFDVDAEGRFLLVSDPTPTVDGSPTGVQDQIIVTLNWTEELARLVPIAR